MAELGTKIHWLTELKSVENSMKIDPGRIVTLVTQYQLIIFSSNTYQSIEKSLIYPTN